MRIAISRFTEALGHKFEEREKQPTCTESGGVFHICTVCGYEYQSEEILPSGHSYESEIIQKATCTEEGERKYHCMKCGNEYTNTIPWHSVIRMKSPTRKQKKTRQSEHISAKYAEIRIHRNWEINMRKYPIM